MMPDDENMCSIAVIRFYAIAGFKPSRLARGLLGAASAKLGLTACLLQQIRI